RAEEGNQTLDAGGVGRAVRRMLVAELGADYPAHGAPQPTLVGEEARVAGRLLEQPSPRLVDVGANRLDSDEPRPARAAGAIEQMVDVVAGEIGRGGPRAIDLVQEADIGRTTAPVGRPDPDGGIAVGIAGTRRDHRVGLTAPADSADLDLAALVVEEH